MEKQILRNGRRKAQETRRPTGTLLTRRAWYKRFRAWLGPIVPGA